MRVATIDIGTNSVLLLVAERRGDTLAPLIERAEITRLGRGVDRTRALDPEAVVATLECLADYATVAREAGATRVTAVATSAMRDARGGEAFRARAQALLGVEPRVISGEEEAALTFAGALSGLGLQGSVLVFDLGGGSTEVIRGEVGPAGAVPARARSLDVGCVRLTERYLRGDPPGEAEIEAVCADARTALGTLEAGFLGGSPRVVGVAGTVTTLAACALGVTPYDAGRVHGARLSAAEIDRLTAEFARLPLAVRRSLPALDPRRADVIIAGSAVVGEILAWAGADALLVSDRGVRWGLAQRLAWS